MPRNGNEMPTQKQWTPGVSRWYWSDGTPLGQSEVDELGLTNAGNAGNFWNDVGSGLGINPKHVEATAPGASLDTSQADVQRANVQGLLEQLQQQAATGGGAWENTLRAATDRSKNTAAALGQSNQLSDYGSALTNIGNAQAGAAQRSAGQADMLRNQSKLSAQDQLGELTGAMGQSDIEQANAAARAKQATTSANQALIDTAQKNMTSLQGGISQMAGPFASAGAGKMSDGGEVPGKPKVFGNNERNDTVPAMLSPGEVVLPRSIAHDPRAAAEFVQALNSQGGVRHMAGGGDTGINTTSADEYGAGNMALSFISPGMGSLAGYGKIRGASGAGAPSIENGGMLDTSQFGQTRQARGALNSMLAERAQGGGPSIANQQSINANDEAISNAMGGTQRGAPAAMMVGAGTQQAQGGAGEAAGQKASEQARGQSQLGRSYVQGRGQELSLAQAQQQAAWENTMQNLGISLADQAALRNMFSGAGQAVTAAAGAGGGGGGGAGAGSNPITSFSTGAGGGGAGATGGGGDAAEVGSGSLGGGFEGAAGGAGEGLAYGGPVGMADGGKVENAADRYARKRREYDEEGDVYRPKGDVSAEHTMASLKEDARREGHAWAQPKKKTTALDDVAEFAKQLGAKASGLVPHLAEGGELEPRRDSGPTYYRPPEQFMAPAGMVTTENGPEAAPFTFVRPGPGDQTTNPAFKSPPGATALGGPDPAQIAMLQAREAAVPLPKGVKAPPVEAAPAEAAPAPAQKSISAGVRPPPSHDLERGYATNAAHLANEQMGAAEDSRYEAEKSSALAEQKIIEDAARDERATRERTRMATSEAMNRWTAAQDEMSRIDAKVDTGRYWANQSTGQKILGIIGLALGAAGTGPDGINRSAQMMNQAIDRDIDAQKAEFEARLKKGAAKVAAAQTYYGMARESGLDDLAATHAAKGAALDAASAKTKAMMAGVNNMEAKAKLMAMSAALDGAALDKKTETERWTADFQQKNQQLNIAAQAAGAKGGLSEGERKAVGDVTAAARDAMGLIGNIESTLARTQSAIPGKTAINQNVGTDAATLGTDIAALTAKLKDVDKLGALSADDHALLMETIGDPKAVFTSESSKRAKLTRLKQIVRDSVANERAARGLR